MSIEQGLADKIVGPAYDREYGSLDWAGRAQSQGAVCPSETLVLYPILFKAKQGGFSPPCFHEKPFVTRYSQSLMPASRLADRFLLSKSDSRKMVTRCASGEPPP